jgi:hypothetical protein
MPGASALGMVSTYLSDNPAILTLADDKNFRRYFKAYQIPALTNLGTAFGMGLIVTSFTLGMSSSLGSKVWLAAICGNLGAIIGAIVSTRIMLFFMKKAYGPDRPALDEVIADTQDTKAFHHKGLLHILDALMEGGKKGVDMGLAIIPGVLIICSIVMMLTNGRPAPQYKYVVIERVSADGMSLYDATGLIEIPDVGNYIYSFEPDSTSAKWIRYSDQDQDITRITGIACTSISGVTDILCTICIACTICIGHLLLSGTSSQKTDKAVFLQLRNQHCFASGDCGQALQNSHGFADIAEY